MILIKVGGLTGRPAGVIPFESARCIRARGSYYPLSTCKAPRAAIEDNESDRESDDITPGDL